MCSVSLQTKETGYYFPLYISSINPKTLLYDISGRTPNLNPEIVRQIAEGLGLTFTAEKEATEGTFAPIDILDYIYAVLHSPRYRETYKEFLKIDFPRVPYPKDAATFWQLVALGGELRQIHLLESPKVEQYITQYPVGGSNEVEKIRFEMYYYSNSIPNENGEIEYPDFFCLEFLHRRLPARPKVAKGS
jgi:predicted helicase